MVNHSVKDAADPMEEIEYGSIEIFRTQKIRKHGIVMFWSFDVKREHQYLVQIQQNGPSSLYVRGSTLMTCIQCQDLYLCSL